MKSIIMFFTCQKVFLSLLVLLTVVPFYLACVYFPKIPLIQYIFLILIAGMKIIVFNEKVLEKKLMPVARKQLTKELGKPPSNQVTFNRVRFYINSRDISMLLSAIAIIIIAIIFQKF